MAKAKSGRKRNGQFKKGRKGVRKSGKRKSAARKGKRGHKGHRPMHVLKHFAARKTRELSALEKLIKRRGG